MRNRTTWLGLALSALVCIGCAGDSRTQVIVATTTSVEDSGLMDALVAAYAEANPAVRLRTVAVGSGEAFEIGRRGDADVLITHAPWEEAQFVLRGHGEENTTIMYNHFVIVGPEGDPAGVRQATSATEAFMRIAAAGAMFLTRGDSSGTHRKELGLWSDAGVPVEAGVTRWYVESGVGMGDLLRVAGERRAYTLSDRATYLVTGANSGVAVLFDDGSDLLYNPYAATLVAGVEHGEAARQFYEWLRGAGQDVIAAYGRERFGRPLFHPAARPG